MECEGDITRIDLDAGHRIVRDGPRVACDLPGCGRIRITPGETVALELPGEGAPDFINASAGRTGTGGTAMSPGRCSRPR